MAFLARAAAALLALAAAAPSIAADPGDRPAERRAAERKSERVRVNPAREAAALTFARLHHPELADLLGRLKEADREAYVEALGDLFQASERLAKLQERDPEAHALALRSWTLDSRIRLLAAKLTMSGDADLGNQIRDLLCERREVRLETLRAERRRAEARIARIDEQIGQIDSDPESVDRDLARLTNEARVARKGRADGKNGKAGAGPRNPGGAGGKNSRD